MRISKSDFDCTHGAVDARRKRRSVLRRANGRPEHQPSRNCKARQPERVNGYQGVRRK